MEDHSFRTILGHQLKKKAVAPHLMPTECRASDRRLCTACHGSTIDYESEISLKNDALQEFWSVHRPGPVSLAPLVRSPRGRRYRSTSKRKVLPVSKTYSFSLLAPDEGGGITPLQVFDCLIEQPEHGTIYRHLHETLSAPWAQPLLQALNYIIVKGNYTEHTVILNVRTVSGVTIKSANAVSRSLTKAVPSVHGVFLFEGEPEDHYYLGSKKAGQPANLRKLFGKDKIYEKVRGRSFLFNPISFSQVNPAILDELIMLVGKHLDLRGDENLYDLYSGYGLFAISFADQVTRAFGAEWSHDSVEDASQNAARNGVKNARFAAMSISIESLERLFSRSHPRDVAILDPPRNGTAPGVIETVASRQIRKVVHLFCNIDLLPTEITRWEQSGYSLDTAIPVDMFPGTDSVEVITSLSPR
ncbi:MAG: hypothetical protein WB699_11485 [Bacteroidota bacterium]